MFYITLPSHDLPSDQTLAVNLPRPQGKDIIIWYWMVEYNDGSLLWPIVLELLYDKAPLFLPNPPLRPTGDNHPGQYRTPLFLQQSADHELTLSLYNSAANTQPTPPILWAYNHVAG